MSSTSAESARLLSETEDLKELVLEAPPQPPFWQSKTAMAVIFGTLLVINALCLLFSTYKVNSVSDILGKQLEFMANHDLPQPWVCISPKIACQCKS